MKASEREGMASVASQSRGRVTPTSLARAGRMKM